MRDRKYAFHSILAGLLAWCLLLSCAWSATALEGEADAPVTARSGAADGMVRVYLSSLGTPSQLDLTVIGSYSLDGTPDTAIPSGSTVTVRFSSTSGALTLTRNGVTQNMGSEFRLRRHESTGTNGVKIAQARQSGNVYPGDVQFKVVQNGSAYKLYTIVHVYIEDYLYGVLPYEMGNSSPLEALKAQCVSARTYTLRAMQSSTARTYDVVDTTNDQVYNGTPSGNARCMQAVDETRGIVAMNGTAFTATYYTASNGGQIEAVSNIWGSSGYDYIVVKDDPYDYQNRNAEVRSFSVVRSGAQSNVTLTDLLLEKAKRVFGAANITIHSVDAVTPHTPRYAAPSRLYTKLDFDVSVTADGVQKSGTLTFDIFSELERQLGMSINADNNELWTVTRTSTGYTVQARRFGHGTGMSQRGAMTMAELGYTYDQILSFYYPGCACVQQVFVRSILSALGSGKSEQVLTADTPVAISQTTAGAGVVQAVNSSRQVALRVSASAGGDIITGIPHGATVTVHAAAGDWYLITYGVLTGYVQKDGLTVSGKMDGQTLASTTLKAYGTVNNGGYLNLRAEPNTSCSVLAEIPSGTVLPLLSISDGWAYTQFGRQDGYVSMDYIIRSDTYTGSAADADAAGAEVTASGGTPLRLSASTQGYSVMQVPQGATVKVKSDDGSWAQVYYAGITGYVLSATLTMTGTVVEEIRDVPGAGERYAVVASTGSSLNLRESASMSAAVMTEMPRGATVIVESAGASWCRVRYHGAVGYCVTQYLALGEGGEESTDTLLTARVTTESGSLNLRKSASLQATVLTRIPRNTIVTVLSRGSEWSRVTYAGYTGYVVNTYLTFGDFTVPDDGTDDTPSVTPTLSPSATVTPSPVVTPSSARVTTASGSLNLRKRADTGASILKRIPQYAIVPVLSISGAWTQVTYDGATGYVMSAFLTYIYDNTSQMPAATPAPTSTPDTKTYARVTTESGSLNLRSRASTSGSLIRRIPQNEVIEVLERLGTWTKVTYEGDTGYVMTSFLTFIDISTSVPTPTPAPQETYTRAQVTTQKGSLNLRERASSGARVLTTIPQNTIIDVISRAGTWTQVRYGNLTGFVMTSFLTFLKEDTAGTATPTPSVDGDTLYAKVTTKEGALNLRKRASASATVLTTIPQYEVIEVLEKGTVWTQVCYLNQTGYVKTEFLTFITTPATPQPGDSGMTTLNTPMAVKTLPDGASIALRAACDESAASLAVILRGEYVLVTAVGTEWCRVDYDGMTGYLPSRYLELK